MDTILSIELLSTNPSVRGRRAYIAGTGLRVTDVVMAQLFHGRSPGELAQVYTAQVY